MTAVTAQRTTNGALSSGSAAFNFGSRFSYVVVTNRGTNAMWVKAQAETAPATFAALADDATYVPAGQSVAIAVAGSPYYQGFSSATLGTFVEIIGTGTDAYSVEGI